MILGLGRGQGVTQMGKLTEDQQLQFARVCKPVMEFLRSHLHPHHQIVIDSSTAELVEGQFKITFERTSEVPKGNADQP